MARNRNTDSQDPMSIDLLVNSTKRFVLRSEHVIDLHDLLESEVQRVLHHLETSTPPGTSDSDQFQRLCTFYESATEPLARMFGVLGRWGSGTEQDIVADAVLALWAHEGGGDPRFAHWHYYPAVLLICSYGVGLTLAKRWSALHGLLSHRNREESERLVDLLVTWLFEGGRSDRISRIFSILNTWRDSFAAVPTDFENLYDTWEILFALAYIEIRVPEQSDKPPIGRNGQYHHSYRRILERINGDLRHDLIAAGFGGGQEERFKAIVNSYSNFIA